MLCCAARGHALAVWHRYAPPRSARRPNALRPWRNKKSFSLTINIKCFPQLTEIIKHGFYHGIFQSWNEHGYSSDWLRMDEDYQNDYLPSNVCFMIKAETARHLVKNYPSYRHPVLGNEGVIYYPPEHNAYVWLHKMPVTTNYDDAVRSVIGEKRLNDKK